MIRSSFFWTIMRNLFDEETMWKFLEGPTMIKFYKALLLVLTVCIAIYFDCVTLHKTLFLGGVITSVLFIVILYKIKTQGRMKAAATVKVSTSTGHPK